MKTCVTCAQEKSLEHFSKDSCQPDKKRKQCKACDAIRAMKYRQSKKRHQMCGDERKPAPPWLTEQHFNQMRAFYHEAVERTIRTGYPYTVDHIIPLNSETVCGLHVPWNLQVLGFQENSSKHNTYDGGWPGQTVRKFWGPLATFPLEETPK